MTQQNKTYKLLPKQAEFINSKEKEILLSGSWGSSKSTGLCLAILKEAITHPNSQILLCRKTYTSLKRSTLQTLIYGENPIIPRGGYKHNKIDQTITLNGCNSVIYLIGVEDILKIRSMNLSFIAVDECNELEESDWIELLGRLRSENGSRKIIGACNPGSPSHFLFKRFFLDNNPNRKVIKSTSLDNPYLPKDYIDTLKEMPKSLYNRYVLGEWIALENVIYSSWDREKNIKERGYGEFSTYKIGVDFGFTAPIGITCFGIDGDNNLHLIEEQKESKLLIGQIVEKCERYRRLEPIIIVDPSAPALIAEFENSGWNVKKADNSVDSGISRFQDYLHKGKITVSRKCEEFIKEIENYIYDDKGKPSKINDHLLDSARYVVNDSVDDIISNYQKPMIYIGEDSDDSL